MIRNIFFCTILFISSLSYAQNIKEKPTWFPKHAKYIANNDTLNYRILLPQNFDETKKYPLHLFLHGIGERGSDNKKQLTYINKVFSNKRNRKKFPAIVIFPQSPATRFSITFDKVTFLFFELNILSYI